MHSFDILDKEELQTISSSTNNEGTEIPRVVVDGNYKIIHGNALFFTLVGHRKSKKETYISDFFDISCLKEGEENYALKETQKSYSFHISKTSSQSGEERFIISIEGFQRQKSNPFDRLSKETKIIVECDGTIIDSPYHLDGISNISEIISQEDRAAFQRILRDLVIGQDLQYECKTSDGTYMEWSFTKESDKIYCLGSNITSLRKTEKELSIHKKNLAEAEAIGQIGQWFWHVGNEKIEFSTQLYRIFGRDLENFEPTLGRINRIVHPRDLGRMMQVFQRAVIEQKDYDMDFRIKHPQDGIRYIRCEGRCKLDSEGEVIALYGIMQDVTEATLRELDLMKAKNSVERAYDAKSRFLANMSHELRTPLNAIIGFSEMMERQLLGPLGNNKYLDYMKGIRESGEHLLDLISDILDMSKIEAGKYELNLEEFNLAKVIRLAVHMMEGRALDDNIKINIDLNNEEEKVVADRRAIMQMILNLLSNAIKFSKENGKIDIVLKKTKENYAILIADNGIGIPANKLANITMPFEQADSDYTKEYEGTGLGLSITKELAEIHGGSLEIQSTRDVGTTVTIHLPYKAKR